MIANGKEGRELDMTWAFFFALRDIAHVWVFQLQASAWG
jgi:hypothetical protein